MSYSFDVAQGVVAKGWFRPSGGDQLTPLHDVVAPELHTLPVDIQVQLKRDFYRANGKACSDDGLIDWSAKNEAQDKLAKEVEEFREEKLHKAFDDSEIRDMAERAARICWRLKRYESMREFAANAGVDPPKIERGITECGAVRRMLAARWWRSKLRKRYTRRAESHLRMVGMVQKRRQLYASNRAVDYRRERKLRDSSMLKEMIAISDAGDQLNLFEVVEKSQANPALRRAELMTRMKGFETIAGYSGHAAIFVTLTCPSAFHRMHSNGTKNDRWEEFTPKEGQSWLCKMWSRVRAKLHRALASIYGFRVAEPHHDGTPHWHLVLFGSRRSLTLARRYLSKTWRAEFSSEPGMWKHRVTFKKIYSEQGSATGYIAKYIAKNIDGFEVGGDYESDNNQDAKQTCDRVAAWASTHGIRQFQQIGGPPVGLWRELRRLRDVVGVEKIEAARQAADAGDWAQFVLAVGGIAVGRNTQITLWKEDDGELNQYDEPRAGRVVGIEVSMKGRDSEISAKPDSCINPSAAYPADVLRIRTRTKCWRIERKKQCAHISASQSHLIQTTATSGSGSIDYVSRSDSLHGSVGLNSFSASDLGPVSITVRDVNQVTSNIVTQCRLNPKYAFIQNAEYKPAARVHRSFFDLNRGRVAHVGSG
jgi:hypothetical protein